MSDEFQIEISIPADNDGFVLLQCSRCGIYFKAKPEDLKDEAVLELYCPGCGLTSEDYLTEDVINLALATSKNSATDFLYDRMKEMERQFHKGPITFKTGKRSEYEPENPIHTGIEAMESTNFPCCHRTAKVKPILIFTGCYCPFCGVKNYEFE